MSSQPWSALISDWFADTLDHSEHIPDRQAWWFGPDEERDKALKEKYSGLLKACQSGQHYRWLESPEGRLAMILAMDQLPRNLFRGTPQAFANDPACAAICLASVCTGHDRELLPIQRVFMYMPLQHAEDLLAQETSISLYQQLADDTPQWPVFKEGILPYARQHRDIIARFGRFPHRNEILGRENTPDEAEYLAGDAPSFGQ